MKTFQTFVNEAMKKSDYEIYHDTYTSAVQSALDFGRRNGYEFDEEDIFSTVSTGPSKPGRGKTNRLTLKLYKGKPDDLKKTKKALHFQVYNRETNKGTFELNAYIG